MMRVLHIDASPRGERSKSCSVADSFLRAVPDHWSITLLEPWSLKLPAMGGDMIEGRYSMIMGEAVSSELNGAWQEVEQIAADFLIHDIFVISTPMWNFGLPYPLKHYIDVVTQPGMTFRNDAVGDVEGLAAGKTAVIIAASAMPIAADSPLQEFDFQQRYLEKWLGFIGITDIQAIRVAPTYGDEDVVTEATNAARSRASELAAQLSDVNHGSKPD